MSKLEVYTTWHEKGKPPYTELVMHLASDEPSEVEAAGEKFAEWLLLNASAGWMTGLRRRLAEQEPKFRPDWLKE